MFMVKDKQSKKAHFFGSKKVILVYENRTDAENAIGAYRTNMKHHDPAILSSIDLEVVPVKVVETE